LKKFLLILAGIAMTSAIAPAALADTYGFSFADLGSPNPPSILPGVSGSGTFDVTAGVVTSWTGTFYLTPSSPAETMTLVGPGTGFANDNTFNISGDPYFDEGGLVFEAGGVDYNLFTWPGSNQVNITTDFEGATYTPVSFDVVTPEPGSLFLLGSGLLLGAFLLARKSKPAAMNLAA